MDIFTTSVDALFPSVSSQNAQREQFALSSLEKGLTAYADGKYQEAIRNLKQAVGWAPTSSTALDAYDYITESYLQLGDSQSAIATLKSSIQLAPDRESTRLTLGNLYTTLGQYSDALAEYQQVVRINPSAANRYTLGQGYLGAGLAGEALAQFEQVRQQSPGDPQGYHGIGQAYSAQGRYDLAISAFHSAIDVQEDYWQAYADLGYALVDSGDTAAAREIVTQLQGNDDDLATLLSGYIDTQEKPRLVAAFAATILPYFLNALGPGTEVADLSIYLADPGAEQLMSLSFQFSKEMDAQSVENVANWSITRALGTGSGDGYNYNLALPSTEVSIAETPYAVYYDAETLTATVIFKVQQNDAGTGTIDPSHINFSFTGQDTYGLTMDPTADTYSGFSGAA